MTKTNLLKKLRRWICSQLGHKWVAVSRSYNALNDNTYWECKRCGENTFGVKPND